MTGKSEWRESALDVKGKVGGDSGKGKREGGVRWWGWRWALLVCDGGGMHVHVHLCCIFVATEPPVPLHKCHQVVWDA